MHHNIEIVSSADVHRNRWDECISRHNNGLIYSSSDYLDNLCDNWDAIIINNYEAVMALPWRKKFGIRYYYTPPFTQQLGLIGNVIVSADDIYMAVCDFAKYGDIHFNYENQWLEKLFVLMPKTNLVLDLARSYETISGTYSKDLSANLKKATKEYFKISVAPETGLAIKTFKSIYSQRLRSVSDVVYKKFENLSNALLKKDRCFVRQVVDAKNNLLSIGLFFLDEKRIYNLMNSTTEAGRKKEANHLLLDTVIKEFAGKPLLFDFEGSDIQGVKSFYEKFGAVNQPYFHYHHNQLPGILKLLKK